MRLRVRHVTHYAYEHTPQYLVQRLHLEPADFASQKTLNWKITAPGIEHALRHVDAFGNCLHLVTSLPESSVIEIVAEGEVESTDAVGVVRGLRASAPDGVFLRTTAATRCDAALLALSRTMKAGASVLETCHRIMEVVHERLAYVVGSSTAHTTAAEAFADGRGVCQDHAHVMIALARQLGIPARYVTGYLVTGTGATATAAHAWAEAAVPDLGWVGFDAANRQCPNDHYVRVAAGLDAASVSPVKGSRRGGAGPEHMSVEVCVEIAQQ
jgi:transglutaminase-like putative cysteine protease